jgi:uncharacterized protein (DUF2236 family)
MARAARRPRDGKSSRNHPEDEAFRRCLTYVREHAAGEVEGLYGPDSVMWKMYREHTILVGVLRATVLQIAHPQVAAAGKHSSNFREDFIGRAYRTLRSMYEVIFGDLEEALAVGRRVHHIHARVAGTVDAASSARLEGWPFRGNDPALLLWVLATIIDSAVVTHEALVAPLREEEKVALHREVILTGALFGIEPERMPPTWDAFVTYTHEMLDGPALELASTGLDLCDAVLGSPLTPPGLGKLVTAGLLPPRFRSALGLTWTEGHRRGFEIAVSTLRRLSSASPALRFAPAYHRGMRRIARSRGDRGSRVERALDATLAFLERCALALPVDPKSIVAGNRRQPRAACPFAAAMHRLRG